MPVLKSPPHVLNSSPISSFLYKTTTENWNVLWKKKQRRSIEASFGVDPMRDVRSSKFFYLTSGTRKSFTVWQNTQKERPYSGNRIWLTFNCATKISNRQQICSQTTKTFTHKAGPKCCALRANFWSWSLVKFTILDSRRCGSENWIFDNLQWGIFWPILLTSPYLFIISAIM